MTQKVQRLIGPALERVWPERIQDCRMRLSVLPCS